MLLVWRAPEDSASHGLCLLVEREQLYFYRLGTNANLFSMEDVENSQS